MTQSPLAKLRAEPKLVLQVPKFLFQSQIGDPKAVNTDNPRLWMLMRAIGRFPGLRNVGLRWSKPPAETPLPAPSESRFFAHVPVERVVSELLRDGFAPGLDLPEEAVEEIRRFAETTPFAPNNDRSRELTVGDLNGDRPTVGEFTHPHALALVEELSKDPVLRRIAREYLGVTPRHTGTRLWWSFPTDSSDLERAKLAQKFHFDLDDFRFLKIFFYITDVDETAGPHVYVRGTHARKRFSHQAVIRRLSDEEVREAYGPENVREVTLPAGKGFAEDTFCIHKGQPPSGKPRLILQFEYAVNDFGYGH